jgi:hypothetical protein
MGRNSKRMGLINQWCYINGINPCHLFFIDISAVYNLLICDRPSRIYSNSAAYYYGYYYHLIGNRHMAIRYFKQGIKSVRCWEALLYIGVMDYIHLWRRYKNVDSRAYNMVMNWAVQIGKFEIAVEIMRTVFQHEKILHWSMENAITTIYEDYIDTCLSKIKVGNTVGTIGVEKYPINMETVNTVMDRIVKAFPSNQIRAKYTIKINELCSHSTD